MITPYEIDQVRRRLERLEQELAETRGELDALERRLEERSAEAPERWEAMPPPLPVGRKSEATLVMAAAVNAAAAKETEETKELPAREEAGETEASPMRAWLEKLQLWPPAAGEGSAEARLGAWWATRVGALLAVAGVVFFGVYVSLNTAPWVKFCELLLVAFGVVAAGNWLERRLPAFGAVVFAGGLALVYFAAYAGYAVPAVRVFPALGWSLLAQVLAVGVMVGAALWRRSAVIATLATGLGYVTAIVSGRGGEEGYALGAAGLLAVVAVAPRRWRSWEGPSVVALPGAYLVFGLGLWAARAAGAEMLPVAAWPYLVAMAVLFYLRDWRGGGADKETVTAEEKWFQGANASAALAFGLVAALGWHRGELEVFYFSAAGLLGLGAWLRWRQGRGSDLVAAILTAKAVGALTIGVIEVAGARNAAVALLAQAWVLAWTARRVESRVLAAACGLVAAVAAGFFLVGSGQTVALVSLDAARNGLFALGFVALATEAARWLVRTEEERKTLELGAAAVAVIGLAAMIAHATPAGWMPGLAMVAAAGFGTLVWVRRGVAAGWAAVALGGLAQVWLWVAALAHGPRETLGWNAVAVLVPTLLVGAFPGLAQGRPWAWTAGLGGGILVLFALVTAPVALAVCVVAACGLVVLARGRKGGWMEELATLALGLGVGCWTVRASEAPASGWVLLAAVAAWAVPVGLRRLGEVKVWRERVQVWAAAVLGILEVMRVWSGAEEMIALLGLTAGVILVLRWGGVEAARAVAGTLTVAVALMAMGLGMGRHGEGFGAGLGAVSLAAAGLVAIPLWLGYGRVGKFLCGGAALSVCFAAAVAQRGELAPYATVGWGLSAAGLFMAGLFLRTGAYRVLGLAGLVMCLPRVFFVDLESALYRIAAFIVLGVVLLWVGFSYHRFRHLVTNTDGDINPTPKS